MSDEKDNIEVQPQGPGENVFPAHLPTAADFASGKIKVISIILRKTGTIVWVYSDKESDAQIPPADILKSLNYERIAIFKLVETIEAEDT